MVGIECHVLVVVAVGEVEASARADVYKCGHHDEGTKHDHRIGCMVPVFVVEVQTFLFLSLYHLLDLVQNLLLLVVVLVP